MKARRLSSVALAVVPLAAAAGAPFFPAVEKGDSWAYVVERGPADQTLTLTLNGVEATVRKSKGEIVFGGFDPKDPRDKRSTDLMHTVGIDACVVDPFLGAVLRRGARCEQAPIDGEVWRDDLEIGDRILQIETRFSGREEVTVGAGMFKALKFECTGAYLNAQGQKFALLAVTYWYAPEVRGVVKIDSRATTRDGAQLFIAALEQFPAK